MTNPLWQAVTIGLVASLFAEGLWRLAPVTFSTLDWALYDTWIRVRAPVAGSELLTVVVRDRHVAKRGDLSHRDRCRHDDGERVLVPADGDDAVQPAPTADHDALRGRAEPRWLQRITAPKPHPHG